MASGGPDFHPRVITSGTEDEQEIAAVTDVETTVTFSDEVKSFLIENDGPFSVHYSRTSPVALTHFKIRPGSSLQVDIPTTNIYLICAAGETATCYIIGVR